MNTRLHEVLKKFKIKSSDPNGLATTQTTDLLGDQHQVCVSWEGEALDIVKKIFVAGQWSTFWEASFSTANNKIRLLSKQGFPPEVSGALDVISYVSKDINSFPLFILDSNHEPARTHRTF